MTIAMAIRLARRIHTNRRAAAGRMRAMTTAFDHARQRALQSLLSAAASADTPMHACSAHSLRHARAATNSCCSACLVVNWPAC